MRLCHVALQDFAWDREAGAGEKAQIFVIEARRLERRLDLRIGVGGVREPPQHLRVLIAEHEFDGAVLKGLNAARGPQHMAELDIFARGQGRQDAPLAHQLALDVRDPRQDLVTGLRLVALQRRDRAVELVDFQLEPELRRLVLHDEQELVVMRRRRQRFLRRQQLVEPQIGLVVEPPTELGMQPGGGMLVARRLRRLSHQARYFSIAASSNSRPRPGAVGMSSMPSFGCGTARHSGKRRGMYSTVRPFGTAPIRCTWISGTPWLTTGTLKASAMPAIFSHGAMPPERTWSIMTISTERASSMWRNGVMPQRYSPPATGVDRASATRANPG